MASADAATADALPPNYEWTQTKEELTITVALPAGTSSAQISVACAKTTLAIGLKGAAAPLVAGELHEAVADSVWSLERGGALTLELEKARPRWWPCALKGGPEVDVQALVAREKAEREPAFKADPSAEAAPRQITDREQLRALKAQFPHLNIKVDGDLHSTEHKNYTGARQAFDWGAVPAVAAEAAAAAAPAPAPAPAPVPTPAQCRAVGGAAARCGRGRRRISVGRLAGCQRAGAGAAGGDRPVHLGRAAARLIPLSNKDHLRMDPAPRLTPARRRPSPRRSRGRGGPCGGARPSGRRAARGGPRRRRRRRRGRRRGRGSGRS